jgi:hypothetical protein
MKKLIFLLGCFLTIGTASAQMSKGDVEVNGGVGFSGVGTMLYGSADYGITKQISLGGELFFRFDNQGGIGYTNIGVLATSNYHFSQHLNLSIPLDLYGGLSLGYYNWAMNTHNEFFSSFYGSGIGLRLQSGARYFFNKNLAANAEWFVENNTFSTGGLRFGVTYLF